MNRRASWRRAANAALLLVTFAAALCLHSAAAFPLLPGGLESGLRSYTSYTSKFFRRAGDRLNVELPYPSPSSNLSFVLDATGAPGTIPVTLVAANNVTTRQNWPRKWLLVEGRLANDTRNCSAVAATLSADGLHLLRAMVVDCTGTRVFVVGNVTLPTETPTEWRVYTDNDVEAPASSPRDSTPLTRTNNTVLGASARRRRASLFCGTTAERACEATLALDLDYEFFVARGSSIDAAVAEAETIVSQMDLQYKRDVRITHRLTEIVVRQAPGAPYTSTDPQSLLESMVNEWQSKYRNSIEYDVAMLLTGKTPNNGNAGLAFVGVVCRPESYSFASTELRTNMAFKTDVVAHELGHNWNAVHCACSDPPSTMNPTITQANYFSTDSADIIADYRDMVRGACLDSRIIDPTTLPPPPPPTDSTSSDSTSPVPIIIGVFMGGCAVLLVLLVVAKVRAKHREKGRQNSFRPASHY